MAGTDFKSDMTGARIIVAVSKDSASKDAIRWALANKIKSPEDVLVLLHIVTKIPSPTGMDMYQSEVNDNMFNLYVRQVVQPLMHSLRKLVDFRVKLELRVGRSNFKEKGILEELKKLKAACLVLGTSSRSIFSMKGKACSTGIAIIKNRPAGVAICVIQRDKVVLSKEPDGLTPPSSNENSPSSSGIISRSSYSGDASPGDSASWRSASAQILDTGRPSEEELMRPPSANQRSPLHRPVDVLARRQQLSGGDDRSSSSSSPRVDVGSGWSGGIHRDSSSSSLVTSASSEGGGAEGEGGEREGRAPPPSGREALPPLLEKSPSANSTGTGQGSPSHSPGVERTPPSGLGGRPSPGSSRRLSGSMTVRSRSLTGMSDVSQEESQPSAKQPPLAGQRGSPAGGPAAFSSRLSQGSQGSPSSSHSHSQAQLPSLSLPRSHSESLLSSGGSLLSTSSSSGDDSTRAGQEYFAELETRLAEARAELDSFPDPTSPAAGYAAVVVEEAPPPKPEAAAAAAPDAARDGEGPEAELRRELAMMRRKAAEAEQKRVEAEVRAQRALQVADRSLREAEAQSRRKDVEHAAIIEKSAKEAASAMLAAEAARKLAELEATKSQQALAQAAKTRQQLEEEARRRQEAEEKARQEEEVRQRIQNYRQYSWEEIEAATDHFKPENKIGEGGFGMVYVGTLHHTPVAVKVLKNTDALQVATEFRQEVEVLGQIQHPHMVMLLGCCPEKYCLVYEYCSNGSLEDRLLCLDETPPLPWYARFRIAAEVASALLVIHKRPVPIVHRDLKPANILLDRNYVAKLGDVGLARLMPGLSNEHTYMRESVPVGTFAYVDPEFQRTGEFGPKSDVYAYGIVLLDLLTGRKPNVYEAIEDAIEAEDKERLLDLLDTSAGKWPADAAMELASLGVRCAEMRRKKRPDLEADVMPILEKIRHMAVLVEEEEARNPGRGRSTEAPSVLFCPITQEMMVNPVIAADGHTYELEAIQEWLSHSDKSPMTNLPLAHKEIVPNHAVRSLIGDWQEKNDGSKA
eukprot:jgi/Mesen1/9181/ME000591S08502